MRVEPELDDRGEPKVIAGWGIQKADTGTLARRRWAELTCIPPLATRSMRARSPSLTSELVPDNATRAAPACVATAQSREGSADRHHRCMHQRRALHARAQEEMPHLFTHKMMVVGGRGGGVKGVRPDARRRCRQARPGVHQKHTGARQPSSVRTRASPYWWPGLRVTR